MILDRPIAFHRAFVDLTGSITAALFLSQAIYWQHRSDGGWWHKSRDEWQDETGMSRREQETARKKLRAFAWYHEEIRGMPRRVHIWIDLDALLADCMTGSTKVTAESAPMSTKVWAECAPTLGRNAPQCNVVNHFNTPLPDQGDNAEVSYTSEKNYSPRENPPPPIYNPPPPFGNGSKKPSGKHDFTPPTFADCRDYFRDLGERDDDMAESFFDHFDNRLSKAWHTSGGRGPLMKDWRRAAKKWQRDNWQYRRGTRQPEVKRYVPPPERTDAEIKAALGVE